jgi:hypothetical protein
MGQKRLMWYTFKCQIFMCLPVVVQGTTGAKLVTECKKINVAINGFGRIGKSDRHRALVTGMQGHGCY